MTNLPLPLTRTTAEHLRERSSWFLAIGIVMVIGGILALLVPLASSLAATLVVGVILFVSGVFHLVHSLQMRRWRGFLWQLVMGIVMVIGGAIAVLNPFAGAAAITTVIAATFIAEGAAQIVLCFQVRPHPGWGWMLFSGIIGILAGLALLWAFPLSAVYAVGTMAGIALLLAGWTYIAIAMAARRTIPSSP